MKHKRFVVEEYLQNTRREQIFKVHYIKLLHDAYCRYIYFDIAHLWLPLKLFECKLAFDYALKKKTRKPSTSILPLILNCSNMNAGVKIRHWKSDFLVGPHDFPESNFNSRAIILIPSWLDTGKVTFL